MEDTLVEEIGSTNATVGTNTNTGEPTNQVEYITWIPKWFPRKVHDLLSWNNVYLSAVVFLAGNVLFLLLLLDKVTLVSLIAYVAILELALSFIFVQCSKVFVGFLGSDFYSPPSLGKPYITEEYLSQQLDHFIPMLNKAIDEWKKTIFCTDNRRTLKLCLVAYILAKLGHVMSVPALFYLCFLYFFTVPIFYHTFRTTVDHICSQVEALAYEYCRPIQYQLQARLEKVVDRCPQRIRDVLKQHLQPLTKKMQ